MSTLAASIDAIDRAVGHDPAGGLPDNLFLLLTRLTPMVNVDLLIKGPDGQTLLTWRDDIYCGKGWHIPGGIVRPKETLAQRIAAVALNELGTTTRFGALPLGLYESIHPRRPDRGHFISVLFACELLGAPDPGRRHVDGVPQTGSWAWHERCPDDLIRVHDMYRPLIDAVSLVDLPFQMVINHDCGDL
jgi:ADP-ribose pyrophosphatase YjhB (NUDIX family)